MNQPSRQERRREEFLRRKQAFRKAARALRERQAAQDRKSTRLNSSHGYISYAVFCLKKKKKLRHLTRPHSTRGSRVHPYRARTVKRRAGGSDTSPGSEPERVRQRLRRLGHVAHQRAT